MVTPVILGVDHPRGVGNITKSGSGGFGTGSTDSYALRNTSTTALWRFEGTTQNGGDIGTGRTSTGYIQVPVATGSSYIATDFEGVA
jgi:hypothetical protein